LTRGWSLIGYCDDFEQRISFTRVCIRRQLPKWDVREVRDGWRRLSVRRGTVQIKRVRVVSILAALSAGSGPASVQELSWTFTFANTTNMSRVFRILGLGVCPGTIFALGKNYEARKYEKHIKGSMWNRSQHMLHSIMVVGNLYLNYQADVSRCKCEYNGMLLRSVEVV
jgi:hypothetical protein